MIKWDKNEIEKLYELNKKGLTNKEISKILFRSEKAIRIKNNRLGLLSNIINKKENIVCEFCGLEFEALISDNRKYCSQSCAAKINDRIYIKRKSNNKEHNKHIRYRKEINNKCFCCGKETKNKFCNSKCQKKYVYDKWISEWKSGFKSGKKGENGTSNYIRKYLFEKYENKCCKCGWCELNVHTNKIPLEIEHKDGNHENNNESNLELLCPNCHSLTTTYKALNKGSGRYSRRQRYKNNKSY